MITMKSLVAIKDGEIYRLEFEIRRWWSKKVKTLVLYGRIGENGAMANIFFDEAGNAMEMNMEMALAFKTYILKQRISEFVEFKGKGKSEVLVEALVCQRREEQK